MGMASTVVACALRFDRATVAHVGDSRCYLIRSNEARAVTKDHTVAAEQQRLGLLSAEEAEHAQTRHVLSRSLGANLFVAVDIDEVQLMPAIAVSPARRGNWWSALTNSMAATMSVCS